jgi:FMNH2-dependent dimethyl sulfone monooxygenase
VVSSWWADEARQYGLQFDQHDDRYARTAEWLAVVDALWTQDRASFAAATTPSTRPSARPKPVRRPVVYAGGESEAAKTMIATLCDAYVMHGDPADAVAPKIADMAAPPRPPRQAADAVRHGRLRHRARQRGGGPPRARPHHRGRGVPPGFANFDQWLSGHQLERELKVQEYSVSNRGLRPNLIGTPEQIQERVAEYEAAGLHLLLLQMSPQAEEMERFAAQVIAPRSPDGVG